MWKPGWYSVPLIFKGIDNYGVSITLFNKSIWNGSGAFSIFTMIYFVLTEYLRNCYRTLSWDLFFHIQLRLLIAILKKKVIFTSYLSDTALAEISLWIIVKILDCAKYISRNTTQVKHWRTSVVFCSKYSFMRNYSLKPMYPTLIRKK